MRTILKFICAFLCVMLVSAKSRGKELQVFAAASLTDVLKEISELYRKDHSNQIIFNFAGSSILARQIQEGASADLFISADEAKVDQLEERNLIVPDTRTRLLSNALVVVLPQDSQHVIKSAGDLLKLRRVALAQPSTVPAGIYAMKYLEAEGLWETMGDRVIPAENVRAALAAVEAGNVDGAIVYATDAAMAKRAKIAWKAPAEKVPEIVYVAAIPKDGRNPSRAASFLLFLQGMRAQEIFRKHGFIPLPKG